MRKVRIREQKMDGEMRRDSRGIRSGRDKLRRRKGARLLQLYQMLCEKKFLNVVITLILWKHPKNIGSRQICI